MISNISTEIKQFLIARFSHQSAFDDLCRETGMANTFAGNFDERITSFLQKASSQFPDYIQRIYNACLSLRPGFETEIKTLFKAAMDSNPEIPVSKDNKKSAAIFLSYSWKKVEAADEVGDAVLSRGFHLVRDISDVKYKHDLTAFMKSIRNCDYAITIISDAYLKSPNCMFEIIELLKEQKFKDKILPIYLDDAKIFTPSDRIDYITYWNKKYSDLKAKAAGLDLAQAGQVAADLKTYEMIRMEIDGFMGAISRMRLIPYDELKADGFREIFDVVVK